MKLRDAIQQRRTVRSFKPDPVPDELVEAVFEAGTWAPSHGNNQPWEFVVIGPETRTGLAARYLAAMEAGPLQNPATPEERKQRLRKFATNFGDAPLLFAVISPPATSPIDRYDFPLAGAAALQNIFLAAWEHGLGGIWLSAGALPPVRELLEVSPDSTVAGVVAMGYPAMVPEPQPRAPVAEKIRRLP